LRDILYARYLVKTEIEFIEIFETRQINRNRGNSVASEVDTPHIIRLLSGSDNTTNIGDAGKTLIP